MGRKGRITEQMYLDTVLKVKSTSDIDIADYLKMDRTTVYRFRVSNPDVFEKAKKSLDEISDLKFYDKYRSLEVFEQLSVIQKWKEMQINRPSRVKDKVIRNRISALFNVCNALSMHPENMNVEEVAKFVVKMRDAKRDKIKVPKGLAFYYIRKPLRSFFMLVYKISGEYLTGIGIDAGRSSGAGSQAKEKVTKEQRENFMPILKNVVYEFAEKGRLNGIDPEMFYYEMEGLTYFMYYSATRIGKEENRGCLHIKLNNPKHRLEKDGFWRINLIDKGKKDGIEWDKPLIDHGKEMLKEYLVKRFKLNYDSLERDVINVDSLMFPILHDNYTKELNVMRETLRRVGKSTKISNHIWRHTFAQDFLLATGYKYELCASIGGWTDTGTLKRHYGAMSEEAKERGLREAMGLPVEKIDTYLRW